ncbi:uncharacterized protein LOC100201613 [Hydra vulgaris]|uniref:uncharacterized protein LOC100201613 n=1 Tax=Hydra vulgaris TaxID=6087 RepID=UPI0001926F3F|nr:DEK domain-containing chromatin-associated protein 4 [Hydra vulgaris]XP_012554085.1 DEK domain-containing chromatin-associated protein 4 [Hydra vulgaris]
MSETKTSQKRVTSDDLLALLDKQDQNLDQRDMVTNKNGRSRPRSIGPGFQGISGSSDEKVEDFKAVLKNKVIVDNKISNEQKNVPEWASSKRHIDVKKIEKKKHEGEEKKTPAWANKINSTKKFIDAEKENKKDKKLNSMKTPAWANKLNSARASIEASKEEKNDEAKNAPAWARKLNNTKKFTEDSSPININTSPALNENHVSNSSETQYETITTNDPELVPSTDKQEKKIHISAHSKESLPEEEPKDIKQTREPSPSLDSDTQISRVDRNRGPKKNSESLHKEKESSLESKSETRGPRKTRQLESEPELESRRQTRHDEVEENSVRSQRNRNTTENNDTTQRRRNREAEDEDEEISRSSRSRSLRNTEREKEDREEDEARASRRRALRTRKQEE